MKVLATLLATTICCVTLTAGAELPLDLDETSTCHLRIPGQKDLTFLPTPLKFHSRPDFVAVDNACNQLPILVSYTRTERLWRISDISSPSDPFTLGYIESTDVCPADARVLYPDANNALEARGTVSRASRSPCLGFEFDDRPYCFMVMTGGLYLDLAQTKMRILGAPVYVAVDRSCNRLEHVVYKNGPYTWALAANTTSASKDGILIFPKSDTCPYESVLISQNKELAQVQLTTKLNCLIPKLPKDQAAKLKAADDPDCYMRMEGLEVFDIVKTDKMKNGAPIYVGVDDNCTLLQRLIYKNEDGQWQIAHDLNSNPPAREGYLEGEYATCPKGAPAVYFIHDRNVYERGGEIVEGSRSSCYATTRSLLADNI